MRPRTGRAGEAVAHGLPGYRFALEVLSRGPLVKRLGLSQDDTYCTRDEYTLLLLLQQGKVSEEDLRETRESFDRLDVDGTGKLSVNDLVMGQGVLDVGLVGDEEDSAEAAAVPPAPPTDELDM